MKSKLGEFFNEQNSNEQIMKLIDSLKDINYTDENNSSILIHAIDAENDEIIEYLLNKGADINQFNDFGIGPLEISIIAGNIKLAKRLFEKQAFFNTAVGITPLHVSAANGWIELIEYFINYYDVNSSDERGCTPLYYAVQEGKFKAVKYLIKMGANIEWTDESNYNLLKCAVGESHIKIIEYLISEFKDVFKDKISEAKELALAYGKTDIYEIISRH